MIRLLLGVLVPTLIGPLLIQRPESVVTFLIASMLFFCMFYDVKVTRRTNIL